MWRCSNEIGEHTFADWREVMATNLDGVFLCSRAAMPVMWRGIAGRRGGGGEHHQHLGLRASTMRVAYGTSKAAVIHLTKQQAIEYGNVGIRFNAVAPDRWTPEMAKLVHRNRPSARTTDAIPLNRFTAAAAEVINAVSWLSGRASYVNGQLLAADFDDANGIGLPTLRRDQRALSTAAALLQRAIYSTVTGSRLPPRTRQRLVHRAFVERHGPRGPPREAVVGVGQRGHHQED